MAYQQPDLSTAAAIGGLILAAFALGLGLRWLWHWVGQRYPRCRATIMGCRCKLRAGHQGLHQSLTPMLWGGDLPRVIPDDIPGWTPRVVDAQGNDVPLPKKPKEER